MSHLNMNQLKVLAFITLSHVMPIFSLEYPKRERYFLYWEPHFLGYQLLIAFCGGI